MGALGAGQYQRRCAGLGDQDPLQLSLAVPQPTGETGHPFPVDGAVGDQPHRPAGDVIAQIPRRGAGHRIGVAAAAGAESGLLGGAGGGEPAAVARFRGTGRAGRATVDAGGGDADVDPTVEPGSRPLSAR